MEPKRDGRAMMAHPLVPVANVDDARATAVALAEHAPEWTTVLHVVEKGGGVPDKTPVEQSEDVAEAAFDAFRERFPDADSRVVYGADVVEAISDAADDVGATAIAFRPRGGSRLVQFLSGDLTLRLVTEIDRPVVCLKTGGEEQS
jgi:nucleotide-binding universal stress UspA family protein